MLFALFCFVSTMGHTQDYSDPDLSWWMNLKDNEKIIMLRGFIAGLKYTSSLANMIQETRLCKDMLYDACQHELDRTERYNQDKFEKHLQKLKSDINNFYYIPDSKRRTLSEVIFYILQIKDRRR